MLQALIKKGKVFAEEVPAPVVSPGSVLIRVIYSCISAGTEMSNVQTPGMPLIKQAMEQPEKVVKALKMFMNKGLSQTLAKAKGDEGIGKTTGYSLAGIVLATGEGISDLQPGDCVAAAGAGIANHAEFVDVPRNLVMRIPEGLDFKIASTVTLGGIALQGVRRAGIQIGELVVVFGTGILGLITVQLVKAAGARCIAVDLEPKRLELAKEFGAELTVLLTTDSDPTKSVLHFTGGHDADIVIFTAATSQSVALSQAFAMTRKKGRLVMVGVYGKEVNRADMYHKELDFLISTAYGPGRYDDNYEQKGLDYPYAYIRWTENRNMQEYLRLLAARILKVDPMIDAVYSIDKVGEAFEFLNKPERPLIVLLEYPKPPADDTSLAFETQRLEVSSFKSILHNKHIRVGLIGAGNFAKAVHLPNLQKLHDKYQLQAICSRTGPNAKQVAAQFGAKYATTDYQAILKDPEIDLVMICTRHNLHGKMVLESLQVGKHTFVEKPLCTTHDDLEAIKSFYGFNQNPNQQINELTSKPLLIVGFNRRFSPLIQEIKRHVKDRINPMMISYRMNSGYLPSNHWVHGEEGGGRIIGEACHIFDLLGYLTENQIKTISVEKITPQTESVPVTDNMAAIIKYCDGSLANIIYTSIGNIDFPKDSMEIYYDGKVIRMIDFQRLEGYGMKINEECKAPEKGYIQALETYYDALMGKTKVFPIELTDLLQTTRATFIADGIIQ